MKRADLVRWIKRTSVREAVELLYLVLLATVAELTVRVVPLRRLAPLLGIRVQAPSVSSAQDPLDPEIGRRAELVDKLYRYWPRQNSCLRRGLVLGFRLRRWEPTLMIGIERGTGDVRAHAWIEIGGAVIGDESGDLAPLRFPQRGYTDA